VNTGKKTTTDWILRIFELFSHKGEFKFTGQWFYTNYQLPSHLRKKMDKQDLILSDSSDINEGRKDSTLFQALFLTLSSFFSSFKVNSIIGRCEVKHQSVRRKVLEMEETFEEGEEKLEVGSNKKGYKYSYRWFYDLKVSWKLYLLSLPSLLLLIVIFFFLPPRRVWYKRVTVLKRPPKELHEEISILEKGSKSVSKRGGRGQERDPRSIIWLLQLLKKEKNNGNLSGLEKVSTTRWESRNSREFETQRRRMEKS
jgi:hypothetical protein